MAIKVSRIDIREVGGEWRGIIDTPAGEHHDLVASTWAHAAARIREFLKRNNLQISDPSFFSSVSNATRQ